MTAPRSGTAVSRFDHIQILRFTDRKFNENGVIRRNRYELCAAGRGKGPDRDIINIERTAKRRIDDRIVHIILCGGNLRFLRLKNGILLCRGGFLIRYGLHGNGIFIGQCPVTAQVELLIGKICRSLRFIGFCRVQGRLIRAAVQTEQRLSLGNGLTALHIFFQNAAGNFRHNRHLIRRRNNTAVFGGNNRIFRRHAICIDGHRLFIYSFLTAATRHYRGNGDRRQTYCQTFMS